MDELRVNAIYFTREPSLGMVRPDGSFEESGGHWRCDACRMILRRAALGDGSLRDDETPADHVNRHHRVPLPEDGYRAALLALPEPLRSQLINGW